MTTSPGGVILYGPPAAGKDTVTRALTQLDGRYALFQRFKVGSGKTAGYRMGSAQQLAALEAGGGVIYANARYGNTYVVDRPGLDEMFSAGLIPVLHLGQIEGVRAVTEAYAARWTTVLLWCTREETEARSVERGDADTEARIKAWHATQDDIAAHPDQVWDVTVRTGAHSPAVTADRVRRASDPGARPA